MESMVAEETAVPVGPAALNQGPTVSPSDGRGGVRYSDSHQPKQRLAGVPELPLHVPDTSQDAEGKINMIRSESSTMDESFVS